MRTMMLPGRPTNPAPVPSMELQLAVSDAEILLTYTGKQSAVQREREQASVARAHQIDMDAATMSDDLG
jgi:hypothetical protein